jgi:hypothetical protein
MKCAEVRKMRRNEVRELLYGLFFVDAKIKGS